MQSILSNMKKLKLSEIDCDEGYEHLVAAILLTKTVMMGGKLPTVVVKRQSDGRFSVVANKMSYIVAHVLNLESIAVEILT